MAIINFHNNLLCRSWPHVQLMLIKASNWQMLLIGPEFNGFMYFLNCKGIIARKESLANFFVSKCHYTLIRFA